MHTNHEFEVSDRTATIASLQKWVDDFSAARDWGKFHKPKDLAMSISIEAAELMEHFQWRSETELERKSDEIGLERPAIHNFPKPMDRSGIADEMADVLSYLLRLASVLEIDLASALQSKMVKNAAKYPLSDPKP